MGLEEKLQQVNIEPLKMSKEERLREAEILSKATPAEMKSMFSQVRSDLYTWECILIDFPA